MRITLEVTAGPSEGTKFHLRTQQIVRVGRTEWADFSIPHDQELADVHFQVECLSRHGNLQDLNSGKETHVNGTPIEKSPLHHGDEITAGKTTFTVQFDNDTLRWIAATKSSEDNVGEEESELEPAELLPTALQTASYLKLGEEQLQLASDDQTPQQFLDLLKQEGQIENALRLQAHLLPKREAIWWSCLCLQSVYGGQVPALESHSLEAAQNWAIEPTEEKRREAELAAEDAELNGAAASVAMAAFLSEGSMTPEEFEEVEPDDRMSGQLLTGALLLVASYGEPLQADERKQTFLELAVSIADGTEKIPEKDE